MKILVDTCVWSQVLRYKNLNLTLESKLKEFIKDNRIVIIGPIRQELLSGISNESQFESLKEHLSYFEDVPLSSEHFVKAAEFSNMCRINGIQGSTTDFLICAIAYLEKLVIFTTDLDFNNYKNFLPIKLFE
ncbi:PIN domain-containing protein [Candidatus Poribacteria bacterium]|nr:PIN domain-containing protein [Candidatus Poribacteria bacterium]